MQEQSGQKEQISWFHFYLPHHPRNQSSENKSHCLLSCHHHKEGGTLAVTLRGHTSGIIPMELISSGMVTLTYERNGGKKRRMKESLPVFQFGTGYRFYQTASSTTCSLHLLQTVQDRQEILRKTTNAFFSQLKWHLKIKSPWEASRGGMYRPFQVYSQKVILQNKGRQTSNSFSTGLQSC